MRRSMLTIVVGAAVLIAVSQFASATPISNGGALKAAAETASAVESIYYYGYRRYGYRGYGYRGYGYGY